MSASIRTSDFKTLLTGIEVKDLKLIKELPRLLGQPHKANFYQILWLTGGSATHRIDFREIHIRENELLIVAYGQICEFDILSDHTRKMII